MSCYGKRIFNVHIKDRVFNGTTVRLGCGDTCFQEIFDNLKSVGYSGNFILQTAGQRIIIIMRSSKLICYS